MDFENRKLIKDLRVVLKDFEQMVKDPKHLWNGRDIENFTLRPREAWANWLVCAVLSTQHGKDFTFIEDTTGDGFIVERGSGIIISTEHVSALNIPKAGQLAPGEQRVIDAINLKIRKGREYAQGKLLVVFFDGAGNFYRSKIREAIYQRHNFEAVFCVGLLESGPDGYSYSVTEFRDSFGEQSTTYKVKINNDFTDYKVTQIIK